MPDPHLRMLQIDLPSPFGDDAASAAAIATEVLLDDIVKGRVSYLVLITFKGAQARVWQLHDAPAKQVDDLFRLLAQREEAEALAVVHPAALPPEVQADRGYLIAAETATGKFDTLIALRGGAGLGGDQFRAYDRRHDEVHHRWLGVEVDGELDLWMEGIVGAVIPGGEA